MKIATSIAKSHLFGAIHTICQDLVIHCKVPNYLEALLYSCTNIKNPWYIRGNLVRHCMPLREGKSMHTKECDEEHCRVAV
jgi:hypothetical protein